MDPTDAMIDATYHGQPLADIWHDMLAASPQEAQPMQADPAEPMFWVRLCSDGMYEGPIHNAQIEKVRRMSGAWSPLYLGAASPQEAPAEPLAYRLIRGSG